MVLPGKISAPCPISAECPARNPRDYFFEAVCLPYGVIPPAVTCDMPAVYPLQSYAGTGSPGSSGQSANRFENHYKKNPVVFVPFGMLFERACA